MTKMRLAAALLLGVVAAMPASAQCVSALRLVAQVNEFPNRPLAQIASTPFGSYGVLRVEPQTRSFPVYFALFDHELNPTTADLLVADNTLNGPLALVWTGSEFGVFYQSLSYQLYLQRIDAGGHLLGSAIAILPNRTQVNEMEYDIAWNPAIAAYAILHTIPTGLDRALYLTTVQANGTVLADHPISYLLSTPTSPRIAITTNGLMGVLWRHDDAPFFALYKPTFELANPQPVAAAGSRPVLASNGTSFVTVFVAPGSGLSELHWVPISATGIPGTEKKLATATAFDIAPNALLWNGTFGEYGLVYVDAPNGLGMFPTDTRLRRLTTIGATIGDTEYSPDLARITYMVRYPVIFDGGAYMGGIDRFVSDAQGSEAYFVRHCPLHLTLAADQGATVYQNTTVTFRVATSGGFGGMTWFWDFGDLFVTSGAAVMTHRYERAGTYTVTVTGKDAQGTVQIATFSIVVTKPKPRIARH
jgi:hypothetical protein